MKIIVYDFEVTSHDWLVVLKDIETGQRTRVHNDSEMLKELVDTSNIYVGFNSKHYDQYIMKACVNDFSPEEVKAVNDYIVSDGGQGWQCPLLQDIYFRFNNVDVKDDMQAGLSLKAIEGHFGLKIRESSISFDLDRPLTPAEVEEMFTYCEYDVDATEYIFKIRKDYFQNKVNLGKLAGLNPVKAMGMTNAKLTAALLKAKRKEHSDEREYQYPDNLLKEYIPKEVFDFFNRMYDKNLSDEDVFKSKHKFMIGECEVTLAYGGIHGAIRNFIWEQKDGRVIRNADVGSYYPHLCTINGYTSRNIPSPRIYEEVLENRMKAKAEGDKKTANALKLVCNTTYGAMLNKYNDLYDPLMGRSVCVSGQLYLLELALHLKAEIDGIVFPQLNTDGIMVECGETDLESFYQICDEWQVRTGFELEFDNVVKIAQKDVNNYLEVQEDGSVKSKGGYLVKGIAPAGAFNVNNNYVVVATALKEYFLNGTSPEVTIGDCNDITQFQIVAKAGVKYKEAYHIIDGEKHPVQKVNRVYATKNTRYGKLHKIKAEDDSDAKIDSLPEHCIIDNDNELDIAEVDKQFYIDMAHKRINDFIGIKPKKKGKRKMATTKTNTSNNVYQKLILARSKFLESAVKKSGKNMHLSFMYFELEDIVPTAMGIFAEVGLLPVVNFTNEVATMDVVNVDKPEEKVTFTAPFNQLTPIVSNTGKQATNEMQALGSSITYMRRYLYMIALDIVEADEIDANLSKEDTTAPTKPTTPPTKEERKEVKKELTASSDKATDLQIKGLKAVLKKVREKDDSHNDDITQLAIDTQSFTALTKADCEALIQHYTEILEGK